MNTIKVLLIDDDALVLDDLRTLIQWEQYGFTIIGEAKNGQQGLELFDKYQPDLVIVDIYMPVLNGLEFCQQVMNKKNPPTIILLTAYKDFEYAKQGIKLGVSNYLLKHEIDEETLTTELLKIKKDLAYQKNNKRMIQQQLFSNLLHQPFSDYNHMLSHLHFPPNLNCYGKIALLFFQIDSPFFLLEPVSKKISSSQISTMSYIKDFATIHRFTQEFPDLEDTQYIPLNNQQSVFVLIFKSNLSSQQNIQNISYRVALYFQQKFNQPHVLSMWYCAADIQSWFINTFKKIITINRNQYSNRIQNAIQYIHTHYDQDLTMEEVAKNLGISCIYLSKLFKKETGQTFLEYLTNYRMERAKYILSKGDYKVYEVAEQVGYKTSQYFSSVFRKNTGMNPSDYIR